MRLQRPLLECHVLLWPLSLLCPQALPCGGDSWWWEGVCCLVTQALPREGMKLRLYLNCVLSLIVKTCLHLIHCIDVCCNLSHVCVSRMRYKDTMRRKAVFLAPPSNPNVEFGRCWTSCFGLLSCFLRLLTLPGMSLSAALPFSSLALWFSSLSVSRCFILVLS